MENKKIVSLSLGVTHSAIVIEDGSLITAGEGYSGQLGIDFNNSNDDNS